MSASPLTKTECLTCSYSRSSGNEASAAPRAPLARPPRSRLLPNLSGKAVVFLRIHAVKEASGLELMENTLVAYTRLDNRLLSGLASLLRPLVGATVTRKLAKGVDVVNRLGLEMRRRPERVLFEATDPPPLPEEEVAFLKEALGAGGTPSVGGRSERSAP